MVIGEDLGTVPPGFRARLRRAGIAGMDVLWFERTRLHFKKPSRWRADAVAMTPPTTSPPRWLVDGETSAPAAPGLGAPAKNKRASRIARGCGAPLQRPASMDRSTRRPPAPAVEAELGYVAQSPSPLMLAPLEDLLGLAEQPNLPGTIEEPPNWRRRLEPPARELFEAPAVRSRVDTIRRHRR